MMFSRLDAIFKNTFRHAEQTDTRMAIKRHEKEQGRSGKEQQKNENEDDDLWSDKTVVSISALRTFLEELVKTPDVKKAFGVKEKAKAPDEAATKNKASDANAPSRRAAMAYQTTAAKTSGNPIPNNPPPDSGHIDRHVYHLTAEEKRHIHTLINDLEQLQQQSLTHLNIPKGESFLQSIIDAVAHENSR